MTFFEHIQAFDRLHDLIKRGATGTPAQLAAKFNVSVGTIKNMITTLRDKGFPIAYSREDETYYYEYEIEVVIFRIKSK
jgi:predicted DNA-binding transcriptional regulator YafY